jgi:hypothetical protein
MKGKLFLLALVGALLLCVPPVLADDGFYVVAGSRGVGTAITSLPYTINNPGFYYLSGNLTYSGGDGITVNSDDVTIDLMGFRLKGQGVNLSVGIHLTGHKNVEVRNGTLSDWHFGYYQDYLNNCGSSRALNLRIENGKYGIGLEGFRNMVKGCIIDTTDFGIYLNDGAVSGNNVTNCSVGISVNNGTIINGNRLYNCQQGIVASGTISGNSVQNCLDGVGITGCGTISGNFISNCAGSISCTEASSVIGNTVITIAPGQIGINVVTTSCVLLTQNAVSGPGTHFTAINGANYVNVANTNAGF